MDVTVRAQRGPFAVLEGPVGRVPDDAIAVMRTGTTQTIIVPEALDWPHDQRQDGWSLIHLEAELPFDVVGFLAKYAAAWADAGIPVLAFASYRFDHVFVPADRLDDAVAIARRVTH